MCVEVRPTDDTYLSRTCINEEVQYDNSGDDDDDDLIVQESDWLERCRMNLVGIGLERNLPL